VAKLKEAEQVITGNGMLGHEWTRIWTMASAVGLIRLSETKMNGVPYPMDAGSVYDQGTATHSLTLYRVKSGALVFEPALFSTWGLDNFHSNPTSRGPAQNPYSQSRGVRSVRAFEVVQQATLNLFADMDPAHEQCSLIWCRPCPSTDKTAPLTKITSPTDGALVAGAVASIKGTATDMGGGTSPAWRCRRMAAKVAPSGGYRSVELRLARGRRARHSHDHEPGDRRHCQRRSAPDGG